MVRTALVQQVVGDAIPTDDVTVEDVARKNKPAVAAASLWRL